MPRIRTIKPDIWADEEFGHLSMLDKLIWVGLITQADDEGRLWFRPRILRLTLFPYDDSMQDEEISKSIESLRYRGLLDIYTIKNKPVIQIKNFKKHQVINRPTPSTIPSSHGVITEDSWREKEKEKEKEKEVCCANAFDEWWSIFPKKVGKIPAARAFDKAMKHIKLDDLIKGTLFYIDECEREDRIIKNPSTFLSDRDRHYEEYHDKALAKEKEIEKAQKLLPPATPTPTRTVTAAEMEDAKEKMHKLKELAQGVAISMEVQDA